MRKMALNGELDFITNGVSDEAPDSSHRRIVTLIRPSTEPVENKALDDCVSSGRILSTIGILYSDIRGLRLESHRQLH